ncbi:hypothetical protein OF83DRAFT_844801 [Amylostereum chailletii]|nr:hypothetical protein OF83DRAFT_844801 [Amylostereum chailletii]
MQSLLETMNDIYGHINASQHLKNRDIDRKSVLQHMFSKQLSARILSGTTLRSGISGSERPRMLFLERISMIRSQSTWSRWASSPERVHDGRGVVPRDHDNVYPGRPGGHWRASCSSLSIPAECLRSQTIMCRWKKLIHVRAAVMNSSKVLRSAPHLCFMLFPAGFCRGVVLMPANFVII